jgi:hypothetical protein
MRIDIIEREQGTSALNIKGSGAPYQDQPAHENAGCQARSGVVAGGWIATSKIKPGIASVHAWNVRNPSQRIDYNQFTLSKLNLRAPGLPTHMGMRRKGTSFMRPQRVEGMLLEQITGAQEKVLRPDCKRSLF